MDQRKSTRPFRVLITRPAEDVDGLASILSGHGVASIIEPLLNIRVLDGPAIDLTGVSAVLATSANGVRAFARRAADRSIRVFAVGEATARAATEAGFGNVEAAGGNVTSLAGLVGRRMDPARGVLLHVAGSAVAGDLAGLLSGAGYTYRRCVLYEARTATVLPERAAEAIRAQTVDGVLLYSPRTARTFCRLVQSSGLTSYCEKLIVFCLSDAVAGHLSSLSWSRVLVTERADQSAMIDAVTQAARDTETADGSDWVSPVQRVSE
ncbi:MAG: uroporphyrinogen-III synthase [Hyphomicrobiales bacterium]|nr:uroporphyrinogen-III synthase [Hyphomicrobiales bacterium]